MKSAGSAALALLLSLGASQAGAEVDSLLEAAEYKLIGEVRLDGINDASGVTYNSARDSLFVIVDDETALYEYSREGVLRRKVELFGFDDTEDVAWLGGEDYAVIEERTGLLLKIQIGETTGRVNRAEALELKRLGSSEHNDGVEGLAYAPDSGNLYLAHELNPRSVSVLNLTKDSFARVTPLWELAWYAIWPLDYSGLVYHPASGLLWVLSDASASLTEYTATGNAAGSIRLRDVNDDRIHNAEGIALDHRGWLYIVAEPNWLYIFKPKRPRFVQTR